MTVSFLIPKILITNEAPFEGLRGSRSNNSVTQQDDRFLTVRKLRKKSLQKADKMVCEKSRAKEAFLKVFFDDPDVQPVKIDPSQVAFSKAKKLYQKIREISKSIDFAEDMAIRIQTFKEQVSSGPDGLKEVLEKKADLQTVKDCADVSEKVAQFMQEYRANFFSHTVNELFEITQSLGDQFKYLGKFCTDMPALQKIVKRLENLPSFDHLKDAKFLKSKLSDIHYYELITICDFLKGAHCLIKGFNDPTKKHFIAAAKKAIQVNQNQLNHLGYKIIKTGEQHFKLVKTKVKITIV